MSARRGLFATSSEGIGPNLAWFNLVFGLALFSITGCAPPEEAVTTTTSPPATTTTTQGSTSTTAAVAETTTTSSVTTTIDSGVIELFVEGGNVVGGPGELNVDLGSVVRVVVLSDVADHLHVHGYDLFFDLSPGEQIEIEFVADVPGIFEVELEEAGLLVLELEVS